MTVFWDVAPSSVVELIAMMMEAESTSETSVNFYQTTRRNIPEDSHFLTRRRENLEYHLAVFRFQWQALVLNYYWVRAVATIILITVGRRYDAE
jgi:hypothetical protein